MALKEVEAAQVTGTRSATAALASLGGRVGAAVVTRGAHGALAAEGGQVIEVATPRVRLVDPSGAGDALCGAIAANLAAGRTLAAAVRTGVLAGAVAVTGLGARGAQVAGLAGPHGETAMTAERVRDAPTGRRWPLRLQAARCHPPDRRVRPAAPPSA